MILPGDADLVSSLEEEHKYETDDAAEKKMFEQLSETRSKIEELGFKVRLRCSCLLRQHVGHCLLEPLCEQRAEKSLRLLHPPLQIGESAGQDEVVLTKKLDNETWVANFCLIIDRASASLVLMTVLATACHRFTSLSHADARCPLMQHHRLVLDLGCRDVGDRERDGDGGGRVARAG